MAEKVIPTPPYWSLAGQLLSGVSLDLANASVASTHPIQPRGVNEPLMFGLPNITGSFTLWKVYLNDGRAEATGAFQKIAESAVYASGSENGTPYKGFTFDASRVSATYGASTVVQPASLCLLPCIKF